MTAGHLDIWTPLAPTAYLGRAAGELPYPLEEANTRLFVRPGHGLFAAISALGLEPGDEVLVPAYHHGSEVEALRRARIECCFYSATPDLEPDPEELAQLAGPRCRALYLLHVLGFPRDAVRWRRWCRDQGLLLIEDATQALLGTIDGRSVGSFGDVALFCLDNTLPVPHLSAAAAAVPIRFPMGPRATDLRRLMALHQSWALEKLGHVRRRDPALPERPADGSVLPESATSVPADASQADVLLGDPTEQPGRWAAHLLPRVLDPEAARVRRQNYRLLLEELADLVPPPFAELPDGSSPFAFPVQVPDKAALMQRLADRGVGCLDFWPTAHPSVPPERAATAASRRMSTVVLPVHQRLSDTDLQRIAGAVRPPARRQDYLRIDPVDDVEDVRPEWAKLAEQAGNVFATWEWHQTWWDAFGHGRSLMVTAVRDVRGTVRGLLPLYLWAQRPYRIARFVGNRAGDQLGPICAPGDERLVGQGLREVLRSGACDVVLGEHLPADSAWSKRLHGRVLGREGSPVLRFHGSWEESTRHWTSHLGQQMRRKERRLRDRFDMRIRTITERSDLEPALDTFFELHRARWAAGTRFAQREAFHREFARRAFENGWLRLRFAELDGDPAAVQLTFQYCGVESLYQTGWDPAYADTSVGTLLLLEAIRRAHAEGMQEFRFLRGGESYKYRFANTDPGLETVLFAQPTASGLAATGAVLAAQRTPRRLRSAVTAKA